eukprot:6975553-Prymnesium_polylepis.1
MHVLYHPSSRPFYHSQVQAILDDRIPILRWSLGGYGKQLRKALGVDKDWGEAEEDASDEVKWIVMGAKCIGFTCPKLLGCVRGCVTAITRHVD